MIEKGPAMNRKSKLMIAMATAVLAILAATLVYAQDKYSLTSPSGIAFSDFKGYEDWSVVSSARTDEILKVIVANPVMINAYKSGIPGNGKPFPDGSKMAKVHWRPKKLEALPTAMVPASLEDVDFMVKDGKRFADSGGWGWGAFKYNAASDTFTPATTSDEPPQSNDAKCGLGCHTIVKTRDYVFTDYGKR